MKAIINTPEQAKVAAQKLVAQEEANNQNKRFAFEEFANTLATINPEFGGFDELGAMLALPDEHFAILAPIFLDELERGLNNVSDKLLMVQSMNMAGLNVEQLREQYEAIYHSIDEQLSDTLSVQKRDFLKRMLGTTYNAISESEGASKRTILIPFEICRTGAKAPAYAHLTDSGMDVYAVEDITIAPGETVIVPTGIKMAIPAGYEIQVRPKSGRCVKTKLRIANTPGTIDAGYRDEIGVIIDNIEPFIKEAEMDSTGRLYNVLFGSSHTIAAGEKFAQLVLCEVPKAILYEVENVGEIANDGRKGGFGSTGVR